MSIILVTDPQTIDANTTRNDLKQYMHKTCIYFDPFELVKTNFETIPVEAHGYRIMFYTPNGSQVDIAMSYDEARDLARQINADLSAESNTFINSSTI